MKISWSILVLKKIEEIIYTYKETHERVIKLANKFVTEEKWLQLHGKQIKHFQMVKECWSPANINGHW